MENTHGFLESWERGGLFLDLQALLCVLCIEESYITTTYQECVTYFVGNNREKVVFSLFRDKVSFSDCKNKEFDK